MPDEALSKITVVSAFAQYCFHRILTFKHWNTMAFVFAECFHDDHITPRSLIKEPKNWITSGIFSLAASSVGKFLSRHTFRNCDEVPWHNMSLMSLKYNSALNRGHVLKVKSAYSGDKSEPFSLFISVSYAGLWCYQWTVDFPRGKTSNYNLLIDVNLSRHTRGLSLDLQKFPNSLLNSLLSHGRFSRLKTGRSVLNYNVSVDGLLYVSWRWTPATFLRKTV